MRTVRLPVLRVQPGPDSRFSVIANEGPLLVGSYGYRLVGVSIVVAVVASYAALDLGGRITATRGRAQLPLAASASAVLARGAVVMLLVIGLIVADDSDIEWNDAITDAFQVANELLATGQH